MEKSYSESYAAAGVDQYLQEKVRPIQFQPAADWQIQEECVEAKEERQHHIESKNEEKK